MPRWPAGSSPRRHDHQFLHILAPVGIALGALAGYEVELVQRSLAVPRWNNNATQVTVYLDDHGATAVSGKRTSSATVRL